MGQIELKQSDITIRRPVEDDTEELHAFFRLVLEEAFEANGITSDAGIGIEEELQEKKKSLAEDLASSGRDRCYLLAEAEGRIVGTIAIGPPGKMMLRLTENSVKDLPELSTGFTHPYFRNQGIATRLLHAMLRRLQGDGVREACFDSGYPIAQSIWRSIFGNPDYLIRDFWGKEGHHMIWRIHVEQALRFLEERLMAKK